MSKMKLFKIVADCYGYDEYDSIVVACESKEKLQKLLDEGYFYETHARYPVNVEAQGYLQDYFYGFAKDQKLKIEEVDLDTMNETTVILCSYNAG